MIFFTLNLVAQNLINEFWKAIFFDFFHLFKDLVVSETMWLIAGMDMGRDCQSENFLSQGPEFQSSESQGCLKDFCPSPKSTRYLCPMGRLWDSQNSDFSYLELFVQNK